MCVAVGGGESPTRWFASEPPRFKSATRGASILGPVATPSKSCGSRAPPRPKNRPPNRPPSRHPAGSPPRKVSHRPHAGVTVTIESEALVIDGRPAIDLPAEDNEVTFAEQDGSVQILANGKALTLFTR